LQAAGWTPSDFNNESPYSIMFGPDKCGSTNKVHFIFRHKNPKTGKYVEHHLTNPPMIINDKLSHVYTAVIYPDHTLKILIDGEEKKTANLLSNDFDPTVVPPETIPDPEDKKPEDWDDRAKIPDPEASKPDDWDEEAPKEIEDEDAEKPEGWLDDEPDEVDDLDAVKPEDWDDEEDGEWEPPKVSNPKCEEAPGCGEWTRPTKKNPAYKGKWRAPLIDNPEYQGIWAPQQIPNPEYFELEKPNLEPIAAIGIEIWTMQDGILFDNVLVSHDEAAATEYREKTWKPKFDAEKEKEAAEVKLDDPGKLSALDGIKAKVFEVLYKIVDLPFLANYKLQIDELLAKGEKNATVTLSILATIPIILLTLLYSLLFGKKKSPPVVSVTQYSPLIYKSC
jgi:calnexin